MAELLNWSYQQKHAYASWESVGHRIVVQTTGTFAVLSVTPSVYFPTLAEAKAHCEVLERKARVKPLAWEETSQSSRFFKCGDYEIQSYDYGKRNFAFCHSRHIERDMTKQTYPSLEAAQLACAEHAAGLIDK